jgi:hypothetical protein
MREAGKGQFNSQPLKGKLIRRDCSIAKAIPSYEAEIQEPASKGA